MKKVNLFWIIILALLLWSIEIIKPNYQEIYNAITNKLIEIDEYNIKIDNKEIHYYSNNEKIVKDIPSYYNNYEFDKELYIYYSYLSEDEQILYKQIYENAIIYNKRIELLTPIPITNVKTTIEALYNDHPELFYLDTNYTYKYNNKDEVLEITLQYNDTINNIENNKKKFDSIVDEIVYEASQYNSDYDREKYVYQKILYMTEYDKDAKLNQSAYSSLVLGRSVCAGYSRAFQLIMQRLNIPTYYVLGEANEEHAWNIIKINNEYYNVDLTWDDTGRIFSHFNISDKEISKTHIRKGVSIYLPKCKY